MKRVFKFIILKILEIVGVVGFIYLSGIFARWADPELEYIESIILGPFFIFAIVGGTTLICGFIYVWIRCNWKLSDRIWKK